MNTHTAPPSSDLGSGGVPVYARIVLPGGVGAAAARRPRTEWDQCPLALNATGVMPRTSRLATMSAVAAANFLK